MFRNEKEALNCYFEIIEADKSEDDQTRTQIDAQTAIDLRNVFVSLNLSSRELEVLRLTVVKKLDYWKAAKEISEKSGDKISADEVFVIKSRLVYRVKKELFNFGLLMFLK